MKFDYEKALKELETNRRVSKCLGDRYKYVVIFCYALTGDPTGIPFETLEEAYELMKKEKESPFFGELWEGKIFKI